MSMNESAPLSPALRVGTPCERCGEMLPDDQRFCPACGTPRAAAAGSRCSKCGSGLREDEQFCAACGQKKGLEVDAHVTATIGQYNQSLTTQRGGKRKRIIAAAVVVAVLVVGYLLYTDSEKSSFAAKLQAKWARIDSGTMLYLDISKTEMDYYADFSIIGKKSIDMIEYEVVAANQIRVGTRVVKVKIADDGDSVTFTPSFTNSESYQIWIKD